MNTLEVENIFSIATTREMEANAFYNRAAKSAKDESVRRLFTELAQEEMGHYELLEKLRHDPSFPMRFQAPSSDYRLAEITDLPPFREDMAPRDAIALAMKKEQQAADFYRSLASRASDVSIKDMLANLANMELGHKRRLEDAFVDIGYPESF